MMVVPERADVELAGICEVCGAKIEFEYFTDEGLGYYDIDDIVNKWMDHQLSDECKSEGE